MLAGEGFRGTKRFEIEGRLGAGGMGVVHRVRDLDRGEVVALKTMMRLDAEALLRFKKEFRALADISHPNVVQLYELFSEGEQWFFTMELLDGVDLLTWVQSSLTLPPPALPTDATGAAVCATVLAGLESMRPAALQPSAPSALSPPASGEISRRFPVRDVGRLRDGFRQLASGLMAIHAAGKLHRDVKPTNVIATRSGRVVLLDFGVASDLADRTGHGVDYAMAGTPAYMAPEQATLARATPASDWYAVGVVLYEALATRLPFEGSAPAILFGKQQRPPMPPSMHVEGIPEDLEQLAMDLLNPDPRARPSGEEVLARLEGERSATVSSPGSQSFVGRRTQLDELRLAYTSSASSLAVVMLHGRSGMGKSALAARFLAELSGEDALVLSGRCYEREAVPFKAVDSVVDELRHWLSRLPEGDVAMFLPPDLGALARVFPVLADLDEPDGRPRLDAPRRAHDDIEPHELRRRAFAAMKELLGNIARRYRLVIHIDDLQWCDADSVQLLEALFAPPSPPWMLLCTYRTELVSSSVPLAELRSALDALGAHCSLRELELSELAPHEAEELARALVGGSSPELAALVTAEACGNPLFLAELARWANDRLDTARGAGGISLEQVILDRVARLSDDARGLLETLSVAGGPLTHAVAARASELASRLRTPALALRSARLVVTRGLGDDDAIEPAHDRVRETIAQSLSDVRRRACHSGIARALAAVEPVCDPEAVFEHFRAAGENDRAKEFVMAAAEAADRALAFIRAASLYKAAIALSAGPLDVLNRRLGDAYANAGQLSNAASAYLAGASHAKPADALELRRLAAEDYLKSGRYTRGLEVMQSVLQEVDLSYPKSKQRALASVLVSEAKLRVAPLRRALRSAQHVDAAHLARIDAAFAAATGLALSDPLRGADFASRGLLLAFEASEPVRLCRALAVAAINTASRGERARSRAEDLVRTAERIAHELDEPRVQALALLAAGTVHFFLGEWRSSRTKLERADQMFRENCRAVAWELANTHSWTCNVLILSGDLSEASRRVPVLMDEARAREDLFALMNLAYPASIARIVADDVKGALEMARVGEMGESDVFTAGRWGSFISVCSVERYRGDGASAWRRAKSESSELEGSMLWQSAMVRVFSCYERGLSAIASAKSGVDRKPALKAAERWAKELSKERLRYAPALGSLLLAGASATDGNARAALSALDAAIPKLDEADLGYLAACARHRKGELLGGASGRELLERSQAFFKTQGIVNTERCLAMSAPGF